jgi:MHS family proline/betaine transporter-like MFS transporter
MALLIASLVTTQGFNWQLAFWIGAGIALIGSIARTRLRETPDFVDMKKRMQKAKYCSPTILFPLLGMHL